MSIYKTIKTKSEGNFIDKGSKFPSYAFEVADAEEIKKYLEAVKELHPKATHHCYAYKLGLDQNNYRANDDGEPSGSAGRPILGQIYSNDLTNVLIIVVRYYGGTKLGVSGLINAYKKAAQDALNNTEIIEKEVQVNFEVSSDYLSINDLLNYLKKMSVSNIDQQFTEACLVKFKVKKSKNDELKAWLTNKNFKFTTKENY
ncbi:MAG: IMPACT family protein [Chitinophagales bacterium]